MKICTLVLLLFVSRVQLRRSSNDLYDFEDLLQSKRDRRPSHSSQQYLLDLLSHEQEFPSSFDEKKIYDEENDDDVDEDESSDPIRAANSDQSSMIEGTTRRTAVTGSEQAGTCTNQYEARSDQLVKVKSLKNNARMIRFVSIDQPPVSSRLSLKEICMLKCCAEKTCDLAMLSEQRTHVRKPSSELHFSQTYSSFRTATNVICLHVMAVAHWLPIKIIQWCSWKRQQRFTPIQKWPRRFPALVSELLVRWKTRSRSLMSSILANAPVAQSRPSTRLSRFIVFILVLGGLVAVALLSTVVFFCRQRSKRGRREKNYSVDADYLINGLYL